MRATFLLVSGITAAAVGVRALTLLPTWWLQVHPRLVSPVVLFHKAICTL
jgi:hypothetical protein